jgi:D-3-phosphoglycerate dehydrogenase / 2-oxoglutarate reductase
MQADPVVVITDSDLSTEDDERVLREAGCTTARLQAKSESELIAGLSQVNPDALIVQWATVTAAVLDAAPRCRFISRLGIGYDMIDVAAATERGVAVANTPDYCVDEVVAHALAMALWLLRGLGRFDAAVRESEWSAIAPFPQACRPSETTIGVVGLGRIGAKVARQAVALGFRVLAYDPYVAAPDGVRLATFEELLSGSDLITLHAPLNEETWHMVRAETIEMMRPGALLVNTCRGSLVDEAALAEALRAERLAGAALDVFEAEPLPGPSPLRQLPNVLLSPHSAWYSPFSLAELPVQAARQVVDFLAGRPVPSIVNPRYAGSDAAAPKARSLPGQRLEDVQVGREAAVHPQLSAGDR